MSALVLGIDVGTSGVRVAAVAGGETIAMVEVAMAQPDRQGASVTQSPAIWWESVRAALAEMARRIAMAEVAAVAVDGTSGTVLAVDARGRPLAPARMYNDSCSQALAAVIANVAPAESAAHGATSALGRAIELQNVPGLVRVLHQADWIAGHLCGRYDVSDENNALKTGYDPVQRCWPEWVETAGMTPGLLPAVVPAGRAIGFAATPAARELGFSPAAVVVAGTTDGCASFLATGAREPGEGVTSLGSTLVLKLLSRQPLFAPAYGLYSHRIGDDWLAGGASNSGGAALLPFFSPQRMAELEQAIDPDQPTGLDYYPLPGRGERFPINDADLAPRIAPRPADDARFLQGLLEGVAGVEALGYRRLRELGGPPLASIRTVGGGARNKAWSRIRSRLLQAPMLDADSEAAAVGTARLAQRGLAATG